MKHFLTLTLGLFMAATAAAQTAGNMKDLSPEQKSAATDVRLTGTLTTSGNSDFRQLRDLCWQLKSVDLSGANCPIVPPNAFHSRHGLKTVTLPANVRTVGSQAFFACDALTELALPASTDSVGPSAFSACKGLKRLVIAGNTRLADFAFGGCGNLEVVEVKAAQPPTIAATAFEGIDRKRCRLIVPAGSERLYRRADGWRRFFSDDQASGGLCRPSSCLVPIPAKLEVRPEAKHLKVHRPWHVVADSGLANESTHARRILADRTGCKFSASRGSNVLELGIDETLADKEAYTLNVSEGRVSIKGRTPEGVFRGLTTFEQLLVGNAEAKSCDAIPQLAISDAPRTHIRELMVDPARIFIPFERLKEIIPEMARYKYNALHLHLVDDQAWRIEIKHYPELTAQGSSRVGMDDMLMPISGFYTQEQMKELVRYAATYYVDIVPEIEMPGHEVAAIHCFPKLTCGEKQVPIRTTCGVSNELLCPGEPFVYEFLGNVFAELAAIFPSPYVHLGGDEAGNPALDCWTACDKCRALKQRLGITSTDRSENWRLQKYLFDNIIDTLRTRHGKTPMFWYETDFKEIQPGCVTFAWRHGLTNAAIDAAISNKARIMLCPGEHCYLDYPMANGDMPEVNWGMPVTSLQQTYALDPSWGRGEDFERNNLFGVAGTLWSECINSPERIYYQAFPRALALAEAGWSRAERRSWEGFLVRLKPLLRDMQRRGVPFSPRF